MLAKMFFRTVNKPEVVVPITKAVMPPPRANSLTVPHSDALAESLLDKINTLLVPVDETVFPTKIYLKAQTIKELETKLQQTPNLLVRNGMSVDELDLERHDLFLKLANARQYYVNTWLRAEVLTDEFLAKVTQLQHEVETFSDPAAMQTQLPEQQLAVLAQFSVVLGEMSGSINVATEMLGELLPKQNELTKHATRLSQLQHSIDELVQSATKRFNADLSYLLTVVHTKVEKPNDFDKYLWCIARSQELQSFYTEELKRDQSKVTELQQCRQTLLNSVCQWVEQTLGNDKRFLNEIDTILKPLLASISLDFNTIRQLNDCGSKLADKLHGLKNLAIHLTQFNRMVGVEFLKTNNGVRLELSLDRLASLSTKAEQAIKAIQSKKLGRENNTLQRLANYQKNQLAPKAENTQLKAPSSIFGLFTQHMHVR